MQKALSAAAIAQDHKAFHLRILNVSKHCTYADYFLIMSATSTRHAQSLADSIMEKTQALGVEGYTNGEWVLLDLGDVVIHIFHEPIRVYFNLDKLWAEAPEVVTTKSAKAVNES